MRKERIGRIFGQVRPVGTGGGSWNPGPSELGEGGKDPIAPKFVRNRCEKLFLDKVLRLIVTPPP